MQETLHFSFSHATPIPFKNPISRPKHLHLPPPSAFKSPVISLPPLPKPSSIKAPENEVSPIIPPPSEDAQIQEILLYLDSLVVDSFNCLHTHPPLISTPLSQIKSTVVFLLSLGLTIHDLRRIFSMCPELLTSSTSTVVIPATTFLLREAFVKVADLRHVIHRRPRLLTLQRRLPSSPNSILPPGHNRNRKRCQVCTAFVLQRGNQVHSTNSVLAKVRVFVQGHHHDVQEIPVMFCYSINENFAPKFNYFLVEMGRELKELVAFPQYFSFSLDNRIKPGHKMCIDNGIYLALPTMLKMTEAQFQVRLKVCCSSLAPVKTSPSWLKPPSSGGNDVT